MTVVEDGASVAFCSNFEALKTTGMFIRLVMSRSMISAGAGAVSARAATVKKRTPKRSRNARCRRVRLLDLFITLYRACSLMAHPRAETATRTKAKQHNDGQRAELWPVGQRLQAVNV